MTLIPRTDVPKPDTWFYYTNHFNAKFSVVNLEQLMTNLITPIQDYKNMGMFLGWEAMHIGEDGVSGEPIRADSWEELEKMITNTWQCDVCGETRIDEAISVLTYPIAGFPDAERNLKYCNDHTECYQKALARSLEGKV